MHYRHYCCSSSNNSNLNNSSGDIRTVSGATAATSEESNPLNKTASKQQHWHRQWQWQQNEIRSCRMKSGAAENQQLLQRSQQ
jgi:hypothetical protein